MSDASKTVAPMVAAYALYRAYSSGALDTIKDKIFGDPKSDQPSDFPSRIPTDFSTPSPNDSIDIQPADTTHGLPAENIVFDPNVFQYYDDTCAIPVKVSRDGVIAKTYHLTANDVGYYIAAGIRPKHVRSLAGDERRVVYPVRISGGMVAPADTFYTDFTDFPASSQPKVLAGCWTVDGYKPSDTSDVAWQPDPFNSWCYGEGLDGARGYKGLMQTSRGARLMFTPARKSCGDMAVELVVAPCKQAGQGFGSPTKQYMDVCLKFDTRTLTGYGLRIIRTTKYHNAVDFVLVKYANGVITPISEPVTGICYLPECSIRIDITDGRLTAHVATTSAMRHVDDPRLHKEITLSADVGDGSHACGVCIQHTGSGGANATVLTSLEIIWR